MLRPSAIVLQDAPATRAQATASRSSRSSSPRSVVIARRASSGSSAVLRARRRSSPGLWSLEATKILLPTHPHGDSSVLQCSVETEASVSRSPGQRSMTTVEPGRRGRASAAASSTTPSCIQTARAAIAIASSTCAPAASARRKMSTTSTTDGSSRSVSRVTQRSPWISAPAAFGLTGMIRLPRRASSAAMRWLSRAGLGEQPTTAHVRWAVSRSRIASSGGAVMPARIERTSARAIARAGRERPAGRGGGDVAAGRLLPGAALLGGRTALVDRGARLAQRLARPARSRGAARPRCPGPRARRSARAPVRARAQA